MNNTSTENSVPYVGGEDLKKTCLQFNYFQDANEKSLAGIIV